MHKIQRTWQACKAVPGNVIFYVLPQDQGQMFEVSYSMCGSSEPYGDTRDTYRRVVDKATGETTYYQAGDQL